MEVQICSTNLQFVWFLESDILAARSCTVYYLQTTVLSCDASEEYVHKCLLQSCTELENVNIIIDLSQSN